MTLTNLQKAPFPWFGGKRDAAPAVWDALGDTPHYVEPFAGSLAVLLERPHTPNRPYHSETVNDIDSLLINFWRAVRMRPEETADAASWPVAEYDKHARSCRLLAWRDTEAGAHLAGDPDWCDPVMAGWWVWAVSVQIGAWGAVVGRGGLTRTGNSAASQAAGAPPPTSPTSAATGWASTGRRHARRGSVSQMRMMTGTSITP